VTWFRIDDSFVGHPKVVALATVAGKHRKGALALWTLAGAWSSRHLTDGFVPSGVLSMLGGTPAEARALVAAELWDVVPDGFQFHDWSDWNPLRSHVEEKRKATRERVAKHRGNGACNALPAETRNGPVTPLPSRPVPSRTEREGDGPSPVPRARPSADLISALVSGTAQAFESMSLPAPKQTRALTWAGWHELAAWCESKARLDGGEPVAIAQTLVVRFLRDKRAKGEGYPLPFLAQNPGQYWEAA
jgi:hypothetical protein